MKEISMSAQKKRKPESLRIVVKWIEGDKMFFQGFKCDAAAMRFVDELQSDGVEAGNIRVMSK